MKGLSRMIINAAAVVGLIAGLLTISNYLGIYPNSIGAAIMGAFS